MLANQQRDQKGRRSSGHAMDIGRGIRDAENDGGRYGNMNLPLPLISALALSNEHAADDHAAFDKIYRSDEAPVVAGKADTRSRTDVLRALSEGAYEKEHMSSLFAQGLDTGSLAYYERSSPGSGWARKEAAAKNELRTVLALPPVANVATLYRGLAMSRHEYEHMIQTGHVQNHRLSFLSSSKSVAEYFASTSPGDVRVIFELDSRNLSADARLHKGKVAFDQYKQIIDDPHIKFGQADMEGLVEAIAIPGHVFEVVSAEQEKPKNKLDNLFKRKSASAAESRTMLVRLQLRRRTLRPMQGAHSRHF